MHVNVPGKVFIMGEYTVIDRQTPAIIAPTKARLDIFITPSDKWRYESPFDGVYEGETLEALSQSLPSKIIASVIPYIKRLDLQNRLESPQQIRIQSALDDGKIPYGLGSSGAVRVGLVKAFLALLDKPLDALEIFQIAALSSALETASYGDLAVSSFDRTLIYQKPETLNPLSHMIIDPVDVPPFIIVHTGKKVSSVPFIDTYMAKRHAPYVKAYQRVMNEIISDFKTATTKVKLDHIHTAHKAYLTMAEHLDPLIIPEAFIPIFLAIEATGGIPKVSGAGGGDNILAFYPDLTSLKYATERLAERYQIFEPAR